jgi:hypothetical protein
MLKILSLVVSFFLGRYDLTFKKATLILIDQFILKSRKLFIFITVVSVSSLLLVSGIMLSLIQATSQYDKNGFIQFNSTLGVGIALILLPLVLLSVLFAASSWETRFKQELVTTPKNKDKTSDRSAHQTEANTPPPNAFEQALTMIVADFLKERETNRAEKTQPKPQPATRTQTYTESNRPIRTENPSHSVIN